jgi:tetrahydromethanopterin S-methyltransferase subunit B
LVLLFAASCYPLLAQEIENDKEQENVEQSIKDVEEKAEKLQTQAFETVDSLSNSQPLTNATA